MTSEPPEKSIRVYRLAGFERSTHRERLDLIIRWAADTLVTLEERDNRRIARALEMILDHALEMTPQFGLEETHAEDIAWRQEVNERLHHILMTSDDPEIAKHRPN